MLWHVTGAVLHAAARGSAHGTSAHGDLFQGLACCAGYKVRKGQMLAVSLWTMQRDDAVWKVRSAPAAVLPQVFLAAVRQHSSACGSILSGQSQPQGCEPS